MRPKVQVLLSTYNGRPYLEPLVQSVLAQVGVDVTLLVRDDGSTDGTPDSLDVLRAAGAPIELHRAANAGAAASFFWLLANASRAAEYVALADQDDVWHAEKLAAGVDALGAHGDAPAMYCSRLTIVDRELRPIGVTPEPRRGPSFANAIVENIATGCTIVLNRAAADVLRDGVPANAAMHDWWIYQVIAGLGTVVVDRTPRVLYRQHDANVVGAATSSFAATAGRVRRLRARGGRLRSRDQLRELRRLHGDALRPADRRILDRHIAVETLAGRLRLALATTVAFQARWKALAFRCLVLANRL